MLLGPLEPIKLEPDMRAGNKVPVRIRFLQSLQQKALKLTDVILTFTGSAMALL